MCDKVKGDFKLEHVNNLRLYLDKAYDNAMSSVSSVVSSLTTTKINTDEKKKESFCLSCFVKSDAFINGALIVLILVLLFVFRYEFWALLTGKERFVNMFGGKNNVYYDQWV